MYEDFYNKVGDLYKRAQHGAISGDEFAYQVGLALEQFQSLNKEAAQQSVKRTGGTNCDFCAGTHGWHEEDCPVTDPARR